MKRFNYIKEALKEPINIWSMVAFTAVGVYMQDLTPLALAAAIEVGYLAIVPTTSFYRRIVENRERNRLREQRELQRQELIKTFDPREREAVEYLRWLRGQICSNYKKFTNSKDVPPQIESNLQTMWEAFVDLLDMYRRRKNHLRSINRQVVQNQIMQIERQLLSSDNTTRQLLERNLDILRQRLKTFDDIEKSIKHVEAQLQSIENFFGLVNDQVVTMPTPENISSLDFESLLSSIEFTKAILEETSPMIGKLNSMDKELSNPTLNRQYRQTAS
ncbi:MAG: hypothetical protein RMM17_07550 [Acidobacteriota bacterium]|nr:hypothetical protein [Blastocatellia bacterium]MDW8412520.1 hypothetical protein [Acidobacteriota bacterium]